MDSLFEMQKRRVEGNIRRIYGANEALKSEQELKKGRKATIGEVREWQGKKYQKQADGNWVPVKGEKTVKNNINVNSVFGLFEKFDSVFSEEDEGIDDFINDLYDDYELSASSEEPETLKEELSELSTRELKSLHKKLSKKISSKT